MNKANFDLRVMGGLNHEPYGAAVEQFAILGFEVFLPGAVLCCNRETFLVARSPTVDYKFAWFKPKIQIEEIIAVNLTSKNKSASL
jgi:hypothetical protein